jgi:hypothetical protein
VAHLTLPECFKNSMCSTSRRSGGVRQKGGVGVDKGSRETHAGRSLLVSAKVANADGAGTDCFTSPVESPVKPVFFGGRALGVFPSEGSKVSASKSNPQASTSGNLRGLWRGSDRPGELTVQWLAKSASAQTHSFKKSAPLLDPGPLVTNSLTELSQAHTGVRGLQSMKRATIT